MTNFGDTPKRVIDIARALNLTITTAESCTGGLVSGALTDIPGSSDVFTCGFVTYSNESKREILGVSSELLERDGAVSPTVAEAMASGALTRSGADIAVSVTGIAGPDGGTKTKPVGLVYVGIATTQKNCVEEYRFGEDSSRVEIRASTVREALALLLSTIQPS